MLHKPNNLNSMLDLMEEKEPTANTNTLAHAHRHTIKIINFFENVFICGTLGKKRQVTSVN